MTITRIPLTAPANAVPEHVAEHTPTYRLNERIAEARKGMGERRWQDLNAEWGA